MELANLIVPMKHICMILNLLKLLNINCNLTASTLQTVLFFSKTKARKKSRATVNLVPRDFPLQMFKKDPRNEFLSPFVTLKKSFYTPKKFRIKKSPMML